MKTYTKLIAFLLITCISGLSHAKTFDHQSWNTLLNQYVVSLPNKSSTQVNYAAIKKNSKNLDAYLNTLSAVSQSQFDSWAKPEQLAFLINAYNAWTVKLIVDDYGNIESIRDLGSLLKSPWKKEFIPLLEKTLSLDDIEHGLIRGSDRYNDPRIHFAVNCASVGCPALREEAFISDKLEMQLDEQTRRFLKDTSRNRLETGTLKVSSIFDWYGADFEKGWQGATKLADFFALYATELQLNPAQVKQLESGDFSIEFLDYDWSLNDVKSK
jgi:Protein of unknown function, DUF547